jgi:curved DNA-binding protein CbpA
VATTYYEILGVSQHATTEEIEAAFKCKASEVHPDRVSPANPYLRNIAAEAFKNLSEAKAVLLDAGKRQKYDADLALSRGSPASPFPGGSPANAYQKSASAAPAPSTPRVPRRLWLVNAPSGLFALGIVFAAILLAGGVALYRARPTQAPALTPAQTTPVPNPPENQSQTKKESRGTASAHPNSGETHLPVPGPKASKSRSIVLWRASEPPDLSALNPAERQAIEMACSYAKLMESPEVYNGCLAKELAVRGHRGSDQH